MKTVGDALKEFASDDSQIIVGVTVDPTIDSGETACDCDCNRLGERKSELNAPKKAAMAVESMATEAAVDKQCNKSAGSG